MRLLLLGNVSYSSQPSSLSYIWHILPGLRTKICCELYFEMLDLVKIYQTPSSEAKLHLAFAIAHKDIVISSERDKWL